MMPTLEQKLEKQLSEFEQQFAKLDSASKATCFETLNGDSCLRVAIKIKDDPYRFNDKGYVPSSFNFPDQEALRKAVVYFLQKEKGLHYLGHVQEVKTKSFLFEF
jgi:hypothetical protein